MCRIERTPEYQEFLEQLDTLLENLYVKYVNINAGDEHNKSHGLRITELVEGFFRGMDAKLFWNMVETMLVELDRADWDIAKITSKSQHKEQCLRRAEAACKFIEEQKKKKEGAKRKLAAEKEEQNKHMKKRLEALDRDEEAASA